MSKKPHDILRRLENGGAVTAKKAQAPSTARPGALEMLQGLALSALSSEHAHDLLARAKGLPKTFALNDLNPERIGGLAPHAVLVNPAFVTLAAESGQVYFLGADGKVHRKIAFDVPGEQSVSEPDTSDAEFWLEPPWFSEFQQLVDERKPVLLIGPAGCGKTEATERVFKHRRQPLHVVQCTPRTRADDLEGKDELVIEDGIQVTRFTPAAPAIASKEGHGLLLDEADAAPAAAMYSVYRLLDGKEMHIVRAGHDSVIERHPEFRVVGTQNTEGRGDDRGLYHARAHQDEAFLDRWKNTIRVDYLKPEQEVVVLRKRTGISSGQAERIVQAASALRNALDQDEIILTTSMRRTISVAENVAGGRSPERAWSLAVVNRAVATDRVKIKSICKRVYGSKWGKTP